MLFILYLYFPMTSLYFDFSPLPSSMMFPFDLLKEDINPFLKLNRPPNIDQTSIEN